MALSFERMLNYALDNADIVREAMLQQLFAVANQQRPKASPRFRRRTIRKEVLRFSLSNRSTHYPAVPRFLPSR